jgi:hypothetical protein
VTASDDPHPVSPDMPRRLDMRFGPSLTASLFATTSSPTWPETQVTASWSSSQR